MKFIWINKYQNKHFKHGLFNHGLGEQEGGGLVPSALEQGALGLGELAQGGQGLACKLGAGEPLRRT